MRKMMTAGKKKKEKDKKFFQAMTKVMNKKACVTPGFFASISSNDLKAMT